MRVHRAHDGRTIEVKQALSQFQGLEDLLDAISLATGISTDNIICMSGQGTQLGDELLAQLTADVAADPAQQVDFFVFNREYLYADVDAVAQELAEEPALLAAPAALTFVQPPTPRSLEAIVAWSDSVVEYIHTHASSSRNHHAALAVIQRSTSIALANLLSHSRNVHDAEEHARTDSASELARMKTLLDGYQRDLEVLGLVTVNPRLLPASSATTNKRTLGDFVSRAKMGAVADACHKVYTELRRRLDDVQANALQLKTDTDDLSAEVHNTDIQPSTDTLDSVARAETDADLLAAFLADSCSPDANGWPVADKLDGQVVTRIHSSFQQLARLDEVTRDCLCRLTADKNDMAARSLALLGDISGLQSDYAELAATLASFRADLGSNRLDGFRHLARLNNMLWAYGATVVEIVRRKEFTRHYLAKSQALAELMAKVSSRERKRRLKFRTDVAGQLPWEVKGMDEAPPSLEISTRSAGPSTAGDASAAITTTTPTLDRQDLDDLLQLFADIEATLAQADAISGDSTAHFLTPIKDAITALITRIDSMDDEFALLVEDHLLGGEEDEEDEEHDNSSGVQSQSSDGDDVRRRRSGKRRLAARNATEANGSAAPDSIVAAEREKNTHLQQELQHLMQQMEDRERADHDKHQAELNALRAESSAARTEARKLKEDLDTARRDAASNKSRLDALQCDVGTEKERRINMQEELTLLRNEAQAARKDEADARREAAEEAERLADVETHLHDLQAELEDAKAARIDATNRIERLLSEGNNIEKELFSAQETIEDLHAQVETARHDARDARDALAEAEAAKERVIRNHRVEADGDRAILEERLRECQVDLDRARAESQRLRESAKMDSEAAQTLRSQLRGADEAHEELVKAMESAKDASSEAELARRHAEREAEMLLEMARPLLERMLAIKTHVQGLPTLSSSRSASVGSTAAAAAPPADEPATRSLVSLDGADDIEASRQAALDAFLAAHTDADASVTLNALRAFSPSETHDETTKKLDLLVTLVRKWQKTYKRQASEVSSKISVAVRDRIAFRNFAIGDLALFLPSRNNALDPKPWAAFNISFPHYFLNAPAGTPLADQLRSKEWIVARIVRIDERVADASPLGNPFQLAEGTKFCVLDVDGWSPNSPLVTRPRAKGRGMSDPDAANGHSGGDRPVAMRTWTGPLQGSREKEGVVEEREREVVEPLVVTGAMQPADIATAPPTVDLAAVSGDSQIGSSGRIAGSAVESAASSSPSALTRAMRAAASRSPSTSRVLANVKLPSNENGERSKIKDGGGSGGGNGGSSAVPATAAHSHPSLEGSAAPAFGGLRGRRRGLRNGGLPVSTATSPGGGDTSGNGTHLLSAATAAASAGRAGDLSFEAVNPFSQSPGGPSGFGSSFGGGGGGVAGHQSSLPKRVSLLSTRTQSLFGPQVMAGQGTAGDATTTGGAGQTSPPTRKTGKSARSPSMTSIAINSGSVTLSVSPVAQAVAMAVPVQAEASLMQARGETAGGGGDGDAGDDEGQVHNTNKDSSGFSVTSLQPAQAHAPSSSFLSFSRTFGRRTSGEDSNSAVNNRHRRASTLFGSPREHDASGGGSSNMLPASASASDLLKRVSGSGGSGKRPATWARGGGD